MNQTNIEILAELLIKILKYENRIDHIIRVYKPDMVPFINRNLDLSSMMSSSKDDIQKTYLVIVDAFGVITIKMYFNLIKFIIGEVIKPNTDNDESKFKFIVSILNTGNIFSTKILKNATLSTTLISLTTMKDYGITDLLNLILSELQAFKLHSLKENPQLKNCDNNSLYMIGDIMDIVFCIRVCMAHSRLLGNDMSPLDTIWFDEFYVWLSKMNSKLTSLISNN